MVRRRTKQIELRRARTGIRRHGMLGALRLLGSRAIGLVYLREAHRWYQFDLRKRPRFGMPEGIRFVEATERELPLLDTLPTVKLAEGERRLGEGASLWLLMEGERAAFACWTLYGRMPVSAAGDCMLELPHGVAALEDSVTAPDYRGRGIAAFALPSICERLVAAGYDTLITKISEDNEPSRRAAQKVGFEDIALMRTTRTGIRRRVAVEPSGNGVGHHLAEHLAS